MLLPQKMDYHSLKRKELQALCKEHNIPANSANSVMADKLSALLNQKQKPVTRYRTCIKSSVEATEVGEPAALKRQAKKVRFSPSNDLFEYELRSAEKQKDMVTQIKTRRKSVVKKVDKPVVDNNTTVELVVDNAQMPVKLTRSRVQSSGEDVVIPNNVKKPSRRESKVVEKVTDVDKETESNVGKVTRSKAHTLKIGGGVQREESRKSKRLPKDVEEASESVEETVVSRARVTRSKTPALMEGGTVSDVNPHVKKKRGKQVETDVEPSKEVMDIPLRATRSKAQALMEGGTVSDVNLHVKKKRGKQVEADEKDVKPSKEVMDIPVRVTRSSRQTLKEDTGNMVANPQADKKRTRSEMKATDLRSNMSHVYPVDKQESPKRKSLRTRGMVIMDDHEDDKVEVVVGGRGTRSTASLSMEAPGRNSKNKANKVEQLEEPSKHAGKKNVNQRKSVLHLEAPVSRPARKNTRRKSVMQKALEMVESPTVGKKQSNDLSGKLSIIEGLGDKENVIRSGKDASENEFKEVTFGSPKSRKRRGTPIVEDHIIETGYGSPFDTSPKRSTRSASKSEGKSVAKEQIEISLKKPVPRMNNQSPVENAFSGRRGALRSGEIIRESTSKKRAKLSGVKPRNSDDLDVRLSIEGTPVAKLGKSDVDEEVREPEVAPALDTRSTVRSERKEPGQSAFKEQRFTRSNIKSKRQETSQSAVKEQPTADTQLFSLKAAKFRHDSVVNTAPGRITRRGVKHGVSAAGSFSEKVGKKKQASQSPHKKPPLADDQMASHKVAEVRPNLDVSAIAQSEFKKAFDEVQMSSPEVAEVRPNTGIETIGAQSEIKQPHNDVWMCSPEVAEVRLKPDSDIVGVESEFSKVKEQIFGDLSASESVRLSSKVVEENTISERETFIDMESGSLVPEVKASGEVMQDARAYIGKSTYENIADAQLSSLKLANLRPDPVVNTVPGRITRRGIRHGGIAAGSFSEKVSKKKASQSAYKKQSLDDDQMGSPKVAEARLNPDVATIGVQSEFKQPLDEVQMSSPDVGPDTGIKTIGVRSEVKQPHVDVQMCSTEAAEVRPSPDSCILGIDTEFSEVKGQISGDLSASESVRLPSKVMDENILSESGNLINMESSSLASEERAHGEVMQDAGTSNEKSTYEASATPCLTEDLLSGKLPNHLELQSLDDKSLLGKNPSHIKRTPGSISDGLNVQNQNEEVYMESGIFHDAASVGTPVLNSGRPDMKEKDMELTESGSTSKGPQTDVIEEQLVSAAKVIVMEEGVVAIKGNNGDADNNCGSISFDVCASAVFQSPFGQAHVESKHMLSAKGGKVGGSGSVQISFVDKHDVADDGEEYDEGEDGSAQKPLLPEPDSENRGVADGVDVQENPFSGNDSFDDSDNAISERKSGLDMFDTPLPGKGDALGDDLNGPIEPETGSERSNAIETLEVSVSGNDINIECVLEDNSDVQDGESEHDLLTSNESPAFKGDVGGVDLEPAQDECTHVVSEVVVQSHDQEPGHILNVAVDDAPCHTIGQSASVTSKDTAKTPATSGLDDTGVSVDTLEESVLDINKDVVSSILGDIYDMDADDDEQKLTEIDEGVQPKGGGNSASYLSNVQTKEEDAMSKGNDHRSDDQEQATTDNLDTGSGRIMEGSSHISENKGDSELVGNIKANDDPTRGDASPTVHTKGESTVGGVDSSQLMEGCPVDDTASDLLTFKEDGSNEREQTRNASTSVDWGDYDFNMDDLAEPVAANKSAVVVGKGKKDDRDPGFQTSDRTSISIEENSDLTAGLVNSARNLEKDSRNADDGKSDPGLDMLNERANADMTEEGFNWSDSSLKSLFATTAATQIDHVKDGQGDGISAANNDYYSSLKPLFVTPTTTQRAHVKVGQQDATSFANNDHYSSLKSLFTTPATSRTSHVTDSKTDAVNFTFQYEGCNDDMGTSGTSALKFNHQWVNDQSKVFDGETETPVQGPENEMYGVSSFEDYPLKLFGDDESVGGSVDRSGKNTHIGFKGDQDDQIKQFEFLSEPSGTSHHLLSDSKEDNSIPSHELKKKEETVMKGSKIGDDLAVDRGK
ncbi:hypothetical protein QVD17_02180 [Tagetes erecta]|uniref:Uncharacterized protein n=1 Tax=Tagetes erecta TaxID=13708 RepID=A0AAD8LBY6_TARER|nr:hypothetical protein QVD17_02180 [Tagetes erecta]